MYHGLQSEIKLSCLMILSSSIVYHVFSHSFDMNVTLFTILQHNIF